MLASVEWWKVAGLAFGDEQASRGRE